MKRRKSNKGESLIETMLSLFVVALGLAMLAGAIAKTSKINSQSAPENVMLFMSAGSGDTDTVSDYQVKFTLEPPSPFATSETSVKCYLVKSEDGETQWVYYK